MSNRDEFQKYYVKRKKPDTKRAYTLRLYLHEILFYSISKTCLQ